MQRKSLVAANWKMELSHKAALETLTSVKKLLKDVSLGIDLVVCPSYPSLSALAGEVAKMSKLQLGAQNVHWEERGAWTGEVAVSQLTPFVKWCIVGHSERRQLVGETDEQVRAKVELLLPHGITPIVCLGETAAEREAGQTVARVTQQAETLLGAVTRVSVSKIVIAYEPIWAIGTGLTPEPDEASQTMLLIRKIAAEQFGNEAAERLRIVYGGSVTPDNVTPFVTEPGIDGVLVGGASIRPAHLIAIAKATSEVHAAS